jgi:hypothetical protein
MTIKKKISSTVMAVKSKIAERRELSTDDAPWIKQVAMLTGILAALSGFLDVRSTITTNNAIYQSNQAILSQTEASDAWNEYQADSIKAHIVGTALATTNNLQPRNRDALEAEEKDLRSRQDDIKRLAQDKTTERDQHLKDGLKFLSEKDLLGYAGLASQLGIALASVAALVRWRLPFGFGILLGVIGVAIAAYALGNQYGIF